MSRVIGSLALAALIVLAASARAQRVPSSKTVLPPSTGARTDVTVPYTTNGRSTLGVANGVAPLIVGKPALEEGDANTTGRPVFNIPFYGAVQSFNSAFFGAVERDPTQLAPRR
jgi:hypothetical protein